MRALLKVIFVSFLIFLSVQTTYAATSNTREQQRRLTEQATNLRQLADQGQAKAQWTLGDFYSSGWGVEKDPAQALIWWTKAAEQGDAEIQHDLAFNFLFGMGVERNYSQALEWMKKSAVQGYAKAQSQLGRIYLDGVGAPQDDAEAYKWLSQASEQHDIIAQGLLGEMYFKGVGVSQDFVKAYMWLNLAASGGHTLAAKMRDNLLSQVITPTQRQAGQSLTKEWLASHPPRGR